LILVAFNSLPFIVFFTTAALIYWAIPHRYRCWFLLAASYYFYASWRAEYLALLLGMTLLSYVTGLVLDGSGRRNGGRSTSL